MHPEFAIRKHWLLFSHSLEQLPFLEPRLGVVQFLDSTPSLVHRRIGVGRGTSVRVGDRDSSEGLAGDLRGAFPGRPFRIEKIVVFVRIAVRPSIDGDGSDVASRIESAATQYARKLVANA